MKPRFRTIVASLAVIFFAVPAWSHGTTTVEEAPPHVNHDAACAPNLVELGCVVDPLQSFTFIGPEGTAIEDRVCDPISNYVSVMGRGARNGLSLHYINRLYGASATPGTLDDAQIADGSVDLYHLEGYGGIPGEEHPEGVERSFSGHPALLGADGFIRGRFESPVEDVPGWDINLYKGDDETANCVYGAKDKDGPWIFAGNAFASYYSPSFYNGRSPIDLAAYYTPLANAYYGTTGPETLEWILIVSSWEKFPYVELEMTPTQTKVESSDGYTYAMPVETDWGIVQGWYLRFQSKAEAIGYPERHTVPGIVTDLDLGNTAPDSVATREWFVDRDPSAASDVDLLAAPDGSGWSFTHGFPNVGTFDVCLRATTAEGTQDAHCETLTVNAPSNNPIGVGYPQDCGAEIRLVDKIGRTPGTTTTRLWEFGDGTTATEAHVRHTYESGTYVVTLTVGNEFATIASATTTVEIAPC